MFRIKSATRLALTIGLIFASLMWLAIGLEIIPDPVQPIMKNRIDIAKSVASNVTTYAECQRFHDLRKAMNRVVLTNDDLLSIGIRQISGRYIVTTPNHLESWNLPEGAESNRNQIAVRVFANNRLWGSLQIAYRPSRYDGIRGMLAFPLPQILFMASSLVLLAWFVLARTFRYLNPAKVVPNRVRSALDTLTEGLVLLDKKGEIAHANQAFSDIVDWQSDQLIGTSLKDIDWKVSDDSENIELPWDICEREGKSICGEILDLDLKGSDRKFIVNATPIESTKGEVRGVLVSFDDVTVLEAKKVELADMIHSLRTSNDEVERKNEQLNFLASYDPLTKCMNRRSFWVQYEKMWENNDRGQLSLFMVDVDHFKLVNDTHGHSVGDDVLRETGAMLTAVIGDRGLVCRYGGEEFAIAIPELGIDEAEMIAMELHNEFQIRIFGGLSITASIGVSNTSLGGMDPQHMLDQADQCLYAAKRNGRNQVVRFDQCPENENEQTEVKVVEVEKPNPIQYSAVTGLLSALAFRSPDTAEHSLRVADLAVAMGEEFLTKRELYNLEVSALLHDIGKIGVPDAILNKPGPLTSKEWEVMIKHDDIGVEIVRSAFACDDISEIIECHHFCFSMRKSGQLMFREEIPLPSRIISVCDAFDAMTSDRVYRKGMSLEDAFSELRRCSPDQFDPKLVEKLITFIESGTYSPRKKSNSVYTSPHSAVILGQHIENLYDAIESKDVDQLRDVVENLKQDATSSNVEPLTQAAKRLHAAIPENADDFEQVLSLADEIMGMCRSTRTAFIENAEKTIKGD